MSVSLFLLVFHVVVDVVPVVAVVADVGAYCCSRGYCCCFRLLLLVAVIGCFSWSLFFCYWLLLLLV